MNYAGVKDEMFNVHLIKLTSFMKMLEKIRNISFFDFCVIWLVTFFTGVVLFMFINKGSYVRSTDNINLPTLREHELYSNDTAPQTLNSSCGSYHLASKNGISLKEALARVVDENIIVLSYVDSGHLDMAFNFIEMSLLKHNIHNVLFLSTSRQTCNDIEGTLCYSCFIIENTPDLDELSTFGSRDFIHKMSIRTHIIHNALLYGYHVLHCDTDVIFLRNPLNDLLTNCHAGCDIAPLWDTRSHNAGFVFIRSTSKSKELYKRIIKGLASDPNKDDQQLLNDIINKMIIPVQGSNEMDDDEFVDPDKLQNMDILFNRTPNPKDILNVQSLPREKYLSGQAYFQYGDRYFAGDNPCPDCIVVHNNWLINKATKIWRFKENHMWMVDKNQYYSNPDSRFISFDLLPPNSFDDEITVSVKDFEDDEFDSEQEDALENGFKLARILNRTLILPKMHLTRFSKGLPAWYVKEKFLQILISSYRDVEVKENSFLSHPKVPVKFTNVKQKPVIIPLHTLSKAEKIMVKKGLLLQFLPSHNDLGPTTDEIKRWFNSDKYKRQSVIHFYSLFGKYSLVKSPFNENEDT